MEIIFEARAMAEFTIWEKENPKIAERIIDLIENITRNPYKGLGKPEALKYGLSGLWSRRINQSNRLVYQITKNNELFIISCRHHYEKK